MKRILMLNFVENLNWHIQKVETKMNFSISSKAESEIKLSAVYLWSVMEAV
jgi:hypothetical protein